MKPLFSPGLPLRSWLLDTGSLTRRLQRHSGSDFSVRVLKQQWERPRLDEARALGIPTHQYVLVREVILCGRSVPWVFARSILPQPAMTGELHFLRKLGNKPLGALLFGNPSIKREPVVLRRYAVSSLPVSISQHIPATGLWGRYSVFRYRQHGILVSEVFLPAFISTLDECCSGSVEV